MVLVELVSAAVVVEAPFLALLMVVVLMVEVVVLVAMFMLVLESGDRSKTTGDGIVVDHDSASCGESAVIDGRGGVVGISGKSLRW